MCPSTPHIGITLMALSDRWLLCFVQVPPLINMLRGALGKLFPVRINVMHKLFKISQWGTDNLKTGLVGLIKEHIPHYILERCYWRVAEFIL